MLYGNFQAKIEMSLFIRGMWDECRVFVSLARSGQARGDMRSMEYDVHRAQLWNEGQAWTVSHQAPGVPSFSISGRNEKQTNVS